MIMFKYDHMRKRECVILRRACCIAFIDKVMNREVFYDAFCNIFKVTLMNTHNGSE